MFRMLINTCGNILFVYLLYFEQTFIADMPYTHGRLPLLYSISRGDIYVRSRFYMQKYVQGCVTYVSVNFYCS